MKINTNTNTHTARSTLVRQATTDSECCPAVGVPRPMDACPNVHSTGHTAQQRPTCVSHSTVLGTPQYVRHNSTTQQHETTTSHNPALLQCSLSLITTTLVIPAVDRYGSGELNANFVYVVNYGRMPNIRASNEGWQSGGAK